MVLLGFVVPVFRLTIFIGLVPSQCRLGLCQTHPQMLLLHIVWKPIWPWYVPPVSCGIIVLIGLARTRDHRPVWFRQWPLFTTLFGGLNVRIPIWRRAKCFRTLQHGSRPALHVATLLVQALQPALEPPPVLYALVALTLQLVRPQPGRCRPWFGLLFGEEAFLSGLGLSFRGHNCMINNIPYLCLKCNTMLRLCYSQRKTRKAMK